LLVASSYGETINWRERLAFYSEMDASVSVPMLIYNTPPAGLLSFEQIRQLSELKNVTGVKDSSGDPELMGDLLAWAKPHDFGVFVGKDSFLYEAISTGARGVVFGAANFIPGQLSKLIALLQTRGSDAESLALWAKIRPVLRLMERATNYVALCKVGCRFRGIDVGDVRPPYLMPDADEAALLRRSLEQLG
jgi:4-hydroxy-tetrahydrodipicolinate synthase